LAEGEELGSNLLHVDRRGGGYGYRGNGYRGGGWGYRGLGYGAVGGGAIAMRGYYGGYHGG